MSKTILPEEQAFLPRRVPTVSILTVTKRNDWVDLAVESLKRQTFKDFEWIIVYEPEVEIQPIEGIKNLRWVKAPPKKNHSNLNASLNEGLRNVTGDYVLFYQDFIELAPDTIENLYYAVGELNAFITTATINPDGKHDMRYTGIDIIRIIEPKEWEANVAIAPMKAIRELGGFDEEYDKGWSWDNVNLAERAELLGYDFYIDERTQPLLHYHIKEPEADPTYELNYLRHEMTMRDIFLGKKPIKLKHL